MEWWLLFLYLWCEALDKYNDDYFFPNILHFSWDYEQMHWWLFFPMILYLIWDYGHMQWWLFYSLRYYTWYETMDICNDDYFFLTYYTWDETRNVHEACAMMFSVFLFEMRHEACAIIFVISVFHMRHGAFAMMIIFWCYTISEWGMALKLGYDWGNYLCSYEMKYLEIMPFIF